MIFCTLLSIIGAVAVISGGALTIGLLTNTHWLIIMFAAIITASIVIGVILRITSACMQSAYPSSDKLDESLPIKN